MRVLFFVADVLGIAYTTPMYWAWFASIRARCLAYYCLDGDPRNTTPLKRQVYSTFDVDGHGKVDWRCMVFMLRVAMNAQVCVWYWYAPGKLHAPGFIPSPLGFILKLGSKTKYHTVLVPQIGQGNGTECDLPLVSPGERCLLTSSVYY